MKYEHYKIYTSRDTTPRQLRLAAEKQAIKENLFLLLSAFTGGILFSLIVLCLSFL
jgi:hypothetical protein